MRIHQLHSFNASKKPQPPGEAWSIKWTDIDSERSRITIRPEKNSNPRQRKISGQLMVMLSGLPHRWPYVFHRPDADPRSDLSTFASKKRNSRKWNGSDMA
jgi:integrase